MACDPVTFHREDEASRPQTNQTLRGVGVGRHSHAEEDNNGLMGLMTQL